MWLLWYGDFFCFLRSFFPSPLDSCDVVFLDLFLLSQYKYEGWKKYESLTQSHNHTVTYSHFFVVLSLYNVIHTKEKEFSFVLSLKYVRKRIFLHRDNVHGWRNDKKVIVWLCEWLVFLPSVLVVVIHLFHKYLIVEMTYFENEWVEMRRYFALLV